MRSWTKEELSLLRKQFPCNPTASLVPVFKRTVEAIKKKAERLGLQKSKKYLKQRAKK